MTRNKRATASCNRPAAILAIIAAVLGMAGAAFGAAGDNVLLICLDDMRPVMGVYGGGAKTPNLDSFVSSGLAFTRHNVSYPVCGPSRASMLSGRRPISTGIYNNGDADNIANAPDTMPTLPQYLLDHGYFTQSLGKVYHGKGTGDGFGWSVSPWKGDWTCYVDFNYVKDQWRPVYEIYDGADSRHVDYITTSKAIDVLNNPPSEPFFLALGIYKPHLPWVAPQSYWDLYTDEEIARLEPLNRADGIAPYNYWWNEIGAYGHVDGSQTWIAGDTDVSNDEALDFIHAYYACASFADAQVGRVLQALEDNGLADNTAVIIWGDHGFHLGDHARWAKHTQHENVMRSPLFVRFPGNQAITGATAAMVESVDIYPTICDYLGLPIPAHTEGKSFLPVVEGSQMSKPVTFSEIRCVNITKNPYFCHSVRTKDFRYNQWQNVTNDNAVIWEELFDEVNDPDETSSVASDPAYAGIMKVHRALLAQHLSEADPLYQLLGNISLPYWGHISYASRLAIEEPVYSDGSKVFSDVGSLAGADYIVTANADASEDGDSWLNFDLKYDTTLYVGYPGNTTNLPGWLSSWTDTGNYVQAQGDSFVYNLYSKDVSKGNITLPANHYQGGDAVDQYIVIAVPNEELPVIENLLTNPGFEEGGAPWNLWTGTVVSGDDPFTGSQSLFLDGSGAQVTVSGLKANTSYVFEAMMKAVSGGTVTLNATPAGGAKVTADTTVSSYKKQLISFATGSSSTSADLQVKAWSGSQGYVDDVALYEWPPSVTGNVPPTFTEDPISVSGAAVSNAFHAVITLKANDPDRDQLTFSLLPGGPGWLSLSTDGILSGTPDSSDIGDNTFTLTVDDGNGGTATATLIVSVGLEGGNPGGGTGNIIGWDRGLLGPPTENGPGLSATLSSAGTGTIETKTGKGSADGTYGTLPSTGVATSANGSFLLQDLSDPRDDVYTFRIELNNTGRQDFVLDQICFDAVRTWNGAPRNWRVTYVSGDLSNSNNTLIATNALVSWQTNIEAAVDFDDVDVDLTNDLDGVALDVTLATNETAVFELTVQDLTGGGETYIDNLAITGTFAPADPDDTDGDGLPDAWEIDMFGSLDASDGLSDSDGDGMIDLYEWMAGTSPVSPGSVLRMDSLTPNSTNANEVVVKWRSVPGKNYRIMCVETLGGSWFTNRSGIQATSSVESVSVPADLTNAFFRVELE